MPPHASTMFDDLPIAREPFQEALYRVAQRAHPGSHAIDELLAAHRQAHGDPEQVAYAAQGDASDQRVPAGEGELDVGEGVREYLEEHRRWCRR